MREEEKFLRREMERLPRPDGAMAVRVQLQVLDPQLIVLLRRAAPEKRANASDQFRKGKRLDQVIIAAELESFHPIRHAIARSQEQNRRQHPLPAQFLDHRPAILFRQHDVEQEEIKAASERHLQAGLAVARHLDRVTFLLQPLGDKGSCLLFVFDQQDAHCGKVINGRPIAFKPARSVRFTRCIRAFRRPAAKDLRRQPGRLRVKPANVGGERWRGMVIHQSHRAAAAFPCPRSRRCSAAAARRHPCSGRGPTRRHPDNSRATLDNRATRFRRR